jgi:glycosyltransferase involved in cell wall biosynthesis
MRIMFLVHSLELAGAERQVVNLAGGLHRRGHQISVATFYPRGELFDEMQSAGVTLHNLGKTKRTDFAGFLWRLRQLVKRERPDVLHGYLESPNILTSLLKTFNPKLRIVWGVRCSAKQLGHYDRISRWISILEPKFARLADLIIVNSQCGASDAGKQGFPAMKIRVIPNGIDTDYFQPDRQAGLRFRQELNIGPEVRLIGRIGRFHAMKDYPTFLDAAASLRQDYPDLKFLCLGRGAQAETSDLERFIATRGLADSVFVRSPTTDMRAVYNALDLLVSSSAFGEGFPNVVGEAMACGTPCIATDVGDSGLLIGVQDLIVPPKRPQALEKACARWLDSPKIWDGGAARTRIVENFSLPLLVDRTEQALIRSFCAP